MNPPTSEQRQRALAGLATLLRARVLEPIQTAWVELLRELGGDEWQAAAKRERRLRQAAQIALEHYGARASMEPAQLAGGSALAEVRASVDALTSSTNATIDQLADLHQAKLDKLASTLDRLVVELHRWFADLDKLDASLRGPEPSPAPPAEPARAPLLALPAAPPDPDHVETEAMTNTPTTPTWPARVEAQPSPRAWWPIVGHATPVSPWPISRHTAPTPTSCEGEDHR